MAFEKNYQAIVKDRFNWPHGLVQLTLTSGSTETTENLFYEAHLGIKICLKSDFTLLVRKPKHHSFSWCRAFFNMTTRSCCTCQCAKSGSSGPALPYIVHAYIQPHCAQCKNNICIIACSPLTGAAFFSLQLQWLLHYDEKPWQLATEQKTTSERQSYKILNIA